MPIRGFLLQEHSLWVYPCRNRSEQGQLLPCICCLTFVLFGTAGYTRVPCLLSAWCNLSLSTVATNYFSAEKSSSRIIIVSINQQAKGFSPCVSACACVCVCVCSYNGFQFRVFMGFLCMQMSWSLLGLFSFCLSFDLDVFVIVLFYYYP